MSELDCSKFDSARGLQPILFTQSRPEWSLPCCEQHDEGFLLGHCLPLLVEEALLGASDAPTVLRCTSSLARLSSILIEFSSITISASKQSLLLKHCLRFLDFPSGESIGYQCTSLLMNLIELHTKDCCQCQDIVDRRNCCEWLLLIGRSLCGLDTDEMLSKIRTKTLFSLLWHSSIGLNADTLRDKLMTNAFIERLYTQIGQASLSIQISKLIADDCCIAIQRNHSHRLNFHLELIKRNLLATEAYLRQAIEQKLLPALLKAPELRAWFRSEFALFTALPPESPYSLYALCSLLRLAIAHIGNEEGNCTLGWDDFTLDFTLFGEGNFMELALNNSDLETRLSALSLICSHPKGARPVTERELQLLQKFVAENFAEHSPAARQQIITQLGKLLSRIREHSKTLGKQKESVHLALYQTFLHFLHRISIEHLRSQSTISILFTAASNHYNAEDKEFIEEEKGSEEKRGFASRVFALMLLSLIHTSEALDAFFGSSDLDVLIASLDDQFELCQDYALNLINQLFPTSTECRIYFDFPLFLEQTKQNLLFTVPHTPRHQLAVQYRLRFIIPRIPAKERINFFDGLLRLGDECCGRVLNNDTEGKKGILLNLTNQPPQLHAILSALLNLLPDILQEGKNDKIMCSEFLERLFSLCHHSAKLISPVVHSLSPEGFLPSDQLSEDFTNNLKSVQLLSKTCWRSHKSVSHIFSRVVERMASPNSLSEKQLIQIGDYFWLQLTECRHCGAFEAAANAFHKVCERFWAFSLEDQNFVCSPSKWLQNIMDALIGKSECQRLCPTRRSAGLPHLVNALLCTEPPDGNRQFPHFGYTMCKLMQCRKLNDRELEVHCVNVLRLLFSQAYLAERMLSHIESAFRITLDGCSLEFWPARNAHVQLFSVLVKCTFGTPSIQQRSLHIQPRCKMSSREFFTRHSSLYHLLGTNLRELCEAAQSGCIGARHLFSAFPLLILLTHLRPVIRDQNQTHNIGHFLPDLLCLLLTLPVRALRELASAALCSLATIGELQEILECIAEINSNVQKQQSDVNTLLADSTHIFQSHLIELKLTKLVSTDAFLALNKFTDSIQNRRREMPFNHVINNFIWHDANFSYFIF